MKICVVGDIMIDETWYCNCTRLSPEAPVPVASLDNKVQVLGGAGNVARNLKALRPDAQVYLCGWIGIKYEHMLQDDNIYLWPGGWTPGNATNIKLRIVDKNKGYHLVRVDNEDSIGCKNNALPYEDVSEWIEEINPDAVIISDYLKGTITYQLAKLIISHKGQRKIFVDTRRADVDMYRDADWLTPNKHEYERMKKYLEASTHSSLKNIINHLRLKGILLTRGSEGMDLLHMHKKRYHVDPVYRDIIDVTGAGDTALAAFTIAMILQPHKPDLALKVANKLASEVCLIKGTAVPHNTLESLESYGNQTHAQEKE